MGSTECSRPTRLIPRYATSIAFARLVDFIAYMESDPFDLLFARNVRVQKSVKSSEANRSIQDTFRRRPREFVYSNNGITVLCEKSIYESGPKQLTLINPRVVNGSQTLHSIRDVDSPSHNARAMVRIIEIPRLSGNELRREIRDRRNVIDNITTRSNLQNPIKRWDLVSNDDFQMELYRTFRRHGYFYQRREGEWDLRSRELRSVGVAKGPLNKKLAQLIASYHWDNAELGPAKAKLSVTKLFDPSAYEQVRKTNPELAFQLFLVNENLEQAYAEWRASRPSTWRR